MKKLLCAILVFVMIVPLCAPVTAVETTATPDAEIKRNSEYGFTYTEQVDEAHNTVRTYNKQENTVANLARTATLGTDSATSTEEKTKAILTDLGMSPAFIEELTTEDLEEYANSPQIISVVTYKKTNAEGETVNVPEEEAVTAGARGGSWIEQVGGDGGFGGGYPTYTGTNENESGHEYMRLTLVVTDKDNGLYKFSLDAEWISPPFFRSYDSLGICAYDVTVENNTRAGWISYKTCTTVYEPGSYSEYTEKTNFVAGEHGVTFHTVTYNDWNGAAVVFHLPLNYYSQYQAMTRRSILVHFEYEGYVHNLSDHQRFNVKGTYEHTKYALTYEPSVSLDFALNPAGVSLSVSAPLFPETEIEIDTYPVQLPTSIEYIP